MQRYHQQVSECQQSQDQREGDGGPHADHRGRERGHSAGTPAFYRLFQLSQILPGFVSKSKYVLANNDILSISNSLNGRDSESGVLYGLGQKLVNLVVQYSCHYFIKKFCFWCKSFQNSQ